MSGVLGPLALQTSDRDAPPSQARCSVNGRSWASKRQNTGRNLPARNGDAWEARLGWRSRRASETGPCPRASDGVAIRAHVRSQSRRPTQVRRNAPGFVSVHRPPEKTAAVLHPRIRGGHIVPPGCSVETGGGGASAQPRTTQAVRFRIPKWGHCNRCDPPLAVVGLQEIEARNYVVKPTHCSPVRLGGQVDDEVVGSSVDVWATEFNLPSVTAADIVPKHVGVTPLEGKSDALAHDSHSVYRVDKGLRTRL